jgi:hypothetical protein
LRRFSATLRALQPMEPVEPRMMTRLGMAGFVVPSPPNRKTWMIRPANRPDNRPAPSYVDHALADSQNKPRDCRPPAREPPAPDAPVCPGPSACNATVGREPSVHDAPV